MDTFNKIRTAYGLKMIAFGIYAMLTIIVCSAIWTCCHETLVMWGAGIILAGNGIMIWRFGKRLYKEYREASRAYFDSLKK